MRSVNGASASEPRYISLSPLPIASGAPLAGADQEMLLALEQIDQREGPARARKRSINHLLRRFALAKFVLDDEGRNFGIGLRRKGIALGGEFLAQRPEIMPLWTTASLGDPCG